MNAQWEALAHPRAEALKTIGGGRLKGMTDVNPQWRYKAMTEAYGPCGIGWKYEVDKLWNEQMPDGQMRGLHRPPAVWCERPRDDRGTQRPRYVQGLV